VRQQRSNQLGLGITVRHRELITTLTDNSSNFKLIGFSGTTPGYDLNPGSTITFPWLSGIARCYEKYRFDALAFEICPRNASTASGSYFAGFDYDYDDSVAASTTELMANRGAISNNIWAPGRVVVDCARLNEDLPHRYVDNVSRASDQGRMAYAGYFMLGIAGTAANCTFDVFAEYTVTLTLPALHRIDVTAETALNNDVTCAIGSVVTPMPNLPIIGNSVPVVSIGSSTCPPLGSYTNGAAYKLPSAADGTLNIWLRPQTAATAPSTFADDTKFTARLYDSNGVLLDADVVTSLVPQAAKWQSPSVAAEWGVAGKPGLIAWNIALDVLRKAFPNASYLLPVVTSIAGRVLEAASVIGAKVSDY